LALLSELKNVHDIRVVEVQFSDNLVNWKFCFISGNVFHERRSAACTFLDEVVECYVHVFEGWCVVVDVHYFYYEIFSGLEGVGEDLQKTIKMRK